MYQMTAKQKREIKKLVDKHVRGAIRDYGVPPECYGVTVDAAGNLFFDTPAPDPVSHTPDASFARAVPTVSGPIYTHRRAIGAIEVFTDMVRDRRSPLAVRTQDPDCVPWRKPSVRIQYMRWRVQQMLEQGDHVIAELANMDYDRALTEPGYYHDGEDKRFICNPMRYSTVRTESQIFINAMWIVPDKRVFTYLYITSQPKRLTHQKE